MSFEDVLMSSKEALQSLCIEQRVNIAFRGGPFSKSCLKSSSDTMIPPP